MFVCRGDRVLLGRRRGAHGAGEWSLPGGKLDLWETPTECAVREVKEETGLDVTNLRAGPFTDDPFPEEGLHFVTLYFRADAPTGEPELLEPRKCEGWHWFPLNALPSPLFCGVEDVLASGFDPTHPGGGA